MTETKREELKARVGPRLITEVESYAEFSGTTIDQATFELLRAGLAKLAPQNGAKNGKRKAVTA